jgi:hypothetical protein
MGVTILPGGLEPVEIELRAHHAYKSKGPRMRGCAVCGEAKTHEGHLGAPPSLNVLGSGNQFVYHNMKAAWQALLVERLRESSLPTGLAHVLAEGECTFPDRRRRDQGNHRFMLEKALGDALQQGGWLSDDCWESYEFGGLACRFEKGVSRTRLLLFPMFESKEAAA